MDGQFAIPPRKEGGEEAKEEKPAADDSLIDFGGAESAAPSAPATQEKADKKPDEIENLLQATGKPADGPLIDFAEDMKKDLPAKDEKS